MGRKKRWCLGLAVALSATLLCGCSSWRDAADTDNADGELAAPVEPAKVAGERILDGILKGIEKEDYSLFAKDFNTELRVKFPKTDFHNVNSVLTRSLGKCESKEFLGELNWGGLKVLLWKARFSVPKNDVLIMLELGYLDDAYRVFKFSFQGHVNIFSDK